MTTANIIAVVLAAAAQSAPAVPVAAPNDYALEQNWLCRPDRRDACSTPSLDVTEVAPDGTRIVRAVKRIAQGSTEKLQLGRLDIARDWGWAPEYVEAMWLMLQQEQPEDFVIASGMQYTVREFINWSAAELGITLRFEGKGVSEKAIVAKVDGDKAPALKVGDIVMKIDARYFRPTEVETLLGDPTKAKEKLGWIPEISVQEMCKEMVASDCFMQSNMHYFLSMVFQHQCLSRIRI